MERSPSAKNKQGNVSTLFTLYQRHFRAALQYEQMLEGGMIKDDQLQELVDSLVAYHRELATSSESMLEAFPETPVKPNKQMLHNQERREKPDLTNPMDSFRTFYQQEEQLMHDYAKLLENPDLPPPVNKQLQVQHQKVKTAVNKIDYIIKAGADRDIRATKG